MSDGVVGHRPARMFWVDRQPMVVRALVKAGAFPGLSLDTYEQEFQRVLAQRELDEPLAAHVALMEALERWTISACEVNPW